MGGTKYDKYFAEEFVKKIKNIEEIEDIITLLKNSVRGDQDTLTNFETLISSKGNKAESERDLLRKEDEKKRIEESKKIYEWSVDELSRLSKGIIKFPPGTGNRWKMIADFVGGERNQK